MCIALSYYAILWLSVNSNDHRTGQKVCSSGDHLVGQLSVVICLTCCQLLVVDYCHHITNNAVFYHLLSVSLPSCVRQKMFFRRYGDFFSFKNMCHLPFTEMYMDFETKVPWQVIRGESCQKRWFLSFLFSQINRFLNIAFNAEMKTRMLKPLPLY